MSGEEIRQKATRLRDGLRRQRELYKALGAITGRQGEVLASGQSDEILELVRSKEAELTRIDDIENDLAPLKKSWREMREEVEAPLRAQVEEELERLEELLKQLIELETQGQKGLETMREETAEKMRRIEGGRRVQQAYGAGATEPQPRYLDRSR